MTFPTEFTNLIAQAQAHCQADPPERTAIEIQIQAIAAYFQTQLLPLSDTLNPAILVEINKQLRLLKTDSLFLRSAQQSVIQTQRLQQMRDRLTLLERYCEMMAELD